MKPKLIIWDRYTGKTTRILETVKWLKALVICPNKLYVNSLKGQTVGDKGFKNVTFISINEILGDKMKGHEDFDIVCMDEFNIIEDYQILHSYIFKLSKLQPVIATSLDNYFEVEK